MNKKSNDNFAEFAEKAVNFLVDTAKDIVGDIRDNYKKYFKD